MHLFKNAWHKKVSITQWSKPDNIEDDSAFLPENRLVDSTGIAALDTNLCELCNRLSSQSCTARLWMQYLCYIERMKTFLTAERTSNQEMHLHAFQAMFSAFAAVNHINYARSGRVYLQQMQDLPSTHPWLHKQFQDGTFASRQSDQLCAGLSPDLVMEQDMMG